jgi:phage terminase small subunit
MTPKQTRFVEEYLVDLNATQAAIRAGYSERTAYSQGQRLLKNVEITDAIAAKRAAVSEQTQITVQQVVAGLHAEAVFMGEGSSHGARVTAWSWLGRHLGAFTDRLILEDLPELVVRNEAE